MSDAGESGLSRENLSSVQFRNVKDFVAFVTLDEYNNREGLIPIAEVARGWIKISGIISGKDRRLFASLLNVDPQKGHIDLSLKDVNEHQRRERSVYGRMNPRQKNGSDLPRRQPGILKMLKILQMRSIANMAFCMQPSKTL